MAQAHASAWFYSQATGKMGEGGSRSRVLENQGVVSVGIHHATARCQGESQSVSNKAAPHLQCLFGANFCCSVGV